MSAAKILWGQVLAVVLIILMSVWAATQWTASALGYQPELGEPWFGLFGHPIYRPYDMFWWWFSYDAYAPKIFDKGGMVAAETQSEVLKASSMSKAHSACSADPWVTGFPLPGGKGFVPYHPNTRGMEAIADARADHLRGGTGN